MIVLQMDGGVAAARGGHAFKRTVPYSREGIKTEAEKTARAFHAESVLDCRFGKFMPECGMIVFSTRTAWDRKPGAWFARRQELAQSKKNVVDLTVANPPALGFAYAPESLGDVLSAATSYEPQALGLSAAREAVAEYYRARGRNVLPEQVWIGAGTSELYAHALSILCDPGDVWLTPQPGYPLFDYLADLAGARLVRYPLVRRNGAWHLGVSELADALAREPRARAIVVISPHNPTGHVMSDAELEAITRLCAARGLALALDEVFLDYPVASTLQPVSRAGVEACLTLCCSGISKVAAYPQGKLSWAVVSGPQAETREFLERAELVSDVFLNASTIIQAGLGALLRAASPLQKAIGARCQSNWAFAKAAFSDSAVSVLDPSAGWMLLLELPAIHDDARWAMRLLDEHHTLAHPGFFYGLDDICARPMLAVSLLTPAAVFQEGMRRVKALVDGGASA